MADKDNKYFEGLGRRKTAIARVRLFPSAKAGQFVVNGKDYKEYFSILRNQQSAVAPFKILDATTKKGAGVEVKVYGGGKTAQAEAITLGLARSLVKFNEDYKKQLKPFGYLTRDPRKVERKKFGLKKARRAPQWKKR